QNESTAIVGTSERSQAGFAQRLGLSPQVHERNSQLVHSTASRANELDSSPAPTRSACSPHSSRVTFIKASSMLVSGCVSPRAQRAKWRSSSVKGGVGSTSKRSREPFETCTNWD